MKLKLPLFCLIFDFSDIKLKIHLNITATQSRTLMVMLQLDLEQSSAAIVRSVCLERGVEREVLEKVEASHENACPIHCEQKHYFCSPEPC